MTPNSKNKPKYKAILRVGSVIALRRRVKLAADELVAPVALRDPQLNRTRTVSGAGAFRWAGPNLSRSAAVCGAVHRKSAQRVPDAVRSAGARSSTKTVHALSHMDLHHCGKRVGSASLTPVTAARAHRLLGLTPTAGGILKPPVVSRALSAATLWYAN